jgi:AcrR family transcriptional regulator
MAARMIRAASADNGGVSSEVNVEVSGEPSGAAPTSRRGRRPAGADTRNTVLTAARTEFAAHGYEKTTMRGIARSAGVDSALLHHYFGTKQQLFIAALDFPLDPDIIVQLLQTGARETAGDRIVRFALSLWEEPSVRERLMAMLRTVAANDQVAGLFRGFVQRELVGRFTAALGEETAAVRVELVMSQILGLAMARYVIGVEPLASAGVDEVAALVGPVLQHYLDAD